MCSSTGENHQSVLEALTMIYYCQGWQSVKLFGSCCDYGVSTVIGVQETSPKSGGKLVILFGSCYDDGVKAVTFLLRDLSVFIYDSFRQFYY